MLTFVVEPRELYIFREGVEFEPVFIASLGIEGSNVSLYNNPWPNCRTSSATNVAQKTGHIQGCVKIMDHALRRLFKEIFGSEGNYVNIEEL
jgi:hypothetical protein